MIAKNYIIEWLEKAPWIDLSQVEQDLILSKIICQLYSNEHLISSVAFRGGTALNKIYFDPPLRYSEDIDLVQINSGPIGDILQIIRKILDPWLGQPKWKLKRGRVVLLYKFITEEEEVSRRVKIEINSREHFSVLGFMNKDFEINSSWFSGRASVTTYAIEELLATKLRALYQRLKGRDLFDLYMALNLLPDINPATIIDCFQEYMHREEKRISRAEFEENMTQKLENQDFLADTAPLLKADDYHHPIKSYELVHEKLITLLPGNSWKGEQKARSTKLAL